MIQTWKAESIRQARYKALWPTSSHCSAFPFIWKTLKLVRCPQFPKKEWTFLNDLYYFYGATYRDLKKDNTKALEYYQKSIQVSQDLNDWPAYWAIYMQGVIANERGDAAPAMQKLNQAEQYGRNEPGFVQEVSRMKDVIQKPH